VQNAPSIIGKRLDLSVDPPPDVVVEIDLSNESLATFPIYGALGVPEHGAGVRRVPSDSRHRLCT